MQQTQAQVNEVGRQLSLHKASTVAQDYMGVWGLCLTRGPGAKPPEANDISLFETVIVHVF